MVFDLLITDATVVTMNESGEVLENGAVGVRDGEIVSVGPTDAVGSAADADRHIDGTDHIVLPGLINAHVHVPDILSRGYGKGRILHDWITNAKRPFVANMGPEDHRLAAAVYCAEAISSGITTFVENAGGTGIGYSDEVIDAKMDVYEQAGLRNVYAHGFVTKESSEEFDTMIASLKRKDPEVDHADSVLTTPDEALARVKTLLERYHGTAGGRQTVWPAPYLANLVCGETLRGAYSLAEEYDVMTTTHTAESELQERSPLSSVEYLHAEGYLGERTLLGHCVQVDSHDIQLLSKTGTKVSHNMAANLELASGIAPVPEMHTAGVTLGLGTDNACLSDLVNLFADLRLVSLVHKGYTRNPTAISPRDVLAMATSEGARAIGRPTLGSIEEETAADLLLIDATHHNLTPINDIYSALVHQMQGHEVETVICDGAIIMEDRTIPALETAFPDLHSKATEATARIAEESGIEPDQ